MTMEHKEKATKTKFKIDGAAEPGKGVSIGQWLSRRVPLWAALAAVVAALAVCALFGALSGGPAEDCAPAAATPGKDSKLLKDDKLRAAMQDSLRKDSIARREFSSPDLAFFDLHGDVKSVKLDYEISYLFYGAPKLLEFNELGQWKCPAKTGRGQTVVYTRTAAGNLVRGEEVRASLELYKNRVIYKDREFILARPIVLKGVGNGEAEQAVMGFLKEVNAAASAKGILPDPIRGSIGVMDGAQFYEVVNAINGVHGTVVLSAYARGDTDALGPLRLIIKEEQLPDQP